MAKAKKQLSTEEALARLEQTLANPPSTDLGDGMVSHGWERKQWVAYHDLCERLPPGLPTDKLVKLLAFESSLVNLREYPPHLDEAVLAMLATRDDDHSTFVRVAYEHGPAEHARLSELLYLTFALRWAGDTSAVALRDWMRPDVVAGAQAAMAVTKPLEYVTSHYLPLLVADASAESFDILLPYFDEALRTKGSNLDWLCDEVLPLMGDTPYGHRLVALLGEATKERTQHSPALEFAQLLGMKPPPALLKLTLSFQAEDGRTVFQIRFDSTRAWWCETRFDEKWQWCFTLPDKLSVPASAITYSLRLASKGADRAALEEWVRRIAPAAKLKERTAK